MRPIIIIIPLLILSACNSSNDNINKVDTVVIQQPFVDTMANHPYDHPAVNGNYLFVWQLNFDNKTKKKNPGLQQNYLHVDSIIKGLNEVFPDIRLEKIRLGHDTLFTEIKNSHYLCESMGTSGAEFYIAEAVVNLTSVDKVRFVKIDFEEGSHASPGIWNKEDFAGYKEID